MMKGVGGWVETSVPKPRCHPCERRDPQGLCCAIERGCGGAFASPFPVRSGGSCPRVRGDETGGGGFGVTKGPR